MKVAICIPCQGYTQALFTLNLGQMIVKTLKARPRLDILMFMAGSSMLTENRNILVEEGLKAGADYLLFMDSDHVFPANALLRLLAHNKDFIGANYARRADPTGPTARKTDENGRSAPVYTTREKAVSGEVEEVDQVGLGLALARASVLRSLKPPLFHFDLEGATLVGEDTYFCRKLRKAGVPIHVDHALSWEVGHIHKRILTSQDAVEQGHLRDSGRRK